MAKRSPQVPLTKPDMTPMIDCVFQLMIFFMLTLKIVAAEGNFDVNMPFGCRGAPDPLAQNLTVHLKSDANGNLANIQFGSRDLGNGEQAFSRLNESVLLAIGGQPGAPGSEDMEVEFHVDSHLHYNHVVKAIGACTGRIDKRTNQVVRYIDKIKLSPWLP